MAILSSKDEKTAAKLRKLNKDDLIWCILEYEKHNLGWPSVNAILADLKYKKDLENIDRRKELAKKAREKTMAYCELIAPYVGKPLSAIPTPVLNQAEKLLREAEAADEEWDRLSGIRRKENE